MPNQSRVLNFVFRQLLQEYVIIMYLPNVKIGFSNANQHPAMNDTQSENPFTK